jgi:hypothetical protein
VRNRVVTFAGFGGPDVLTLEDAPLPEPGPGEVRVRMAYAGLNPVDYKIRRGGPQYETLLPAASSRASSTQRGPRSSASPPATSCSARSPSEPWLTR